MGIIGSISTIKTWAIVKCIFRLSHTIFNCAAAWMYRSCAV